MQDLRGSELVGGNFDKNNEVFATDWDLIIVDEAHEGTQTELGKAVMGELVKEQTKVLRLSGTHSTCWMISKRMKSIHGTM